MSTTIDSAPFIKKVRETLEAEGWTQSQLASETGLSPAQLSRLLAGKNKRVQQATVDKIATALGVSHAEFFASPVNKNKAITLSAANAPVIYSDRLPTVTGQFVGRTAELKTIDKALHDDAVNILQLIAPGGTGKTKLLRQWLNTSRDKNQSVIAWSFYSQGASSDKQVSANPFFQHAFKCLHVEPPKFASDEDKGDYLAGLLRAKKCLLILDGLEPLQYADPANRGELKDRALSRLLRNLSGESGAGCIITSRIAIYELSDRTSVLSHNLQNLALNDGVALLQSLGVQGSEQAIRQAVEDYNGHALALSLLGNLLRLRYQGDVSQRGNLPALMLKGLDKSSRHAFKVMQAYKDWFSGTPELCLLYLLGLFDRPVEIEALEALWIASIPSLTEGIQEVEWYQAIDSLQHDHHLLPDAGHSKQGNHTHQALDCHPLIREYFGQQLKESQPVAWHKAHECLYEHYKALPEKELPDTLEEMRPLFDAIKHGCLAGLYEESYEVYWLRVSQKTERYLSLKLGAYGDDLAVVSHFFAKPWDKINGNLDKIIQTFLTFTATADLNALGRIKEAYKPSKQFLAYLVDQKLWRQAVVLSERISQQQLTLGSLQEALETAQLGINYSASSESPLDRIKLRILFAHALYQSGDTQAAKDLFQEVEQTLTQEDSASPLLNSMPEYYELLADQGLVDIFLKKIKEFQDWSQHNTIDASAAISVALTLSNLARVFMMQLNLSQAMTTAENAITLIRQSGRKDLRPQVLLIRAAIYRATGNFIKASQDLQEVYDIAEPSGMRLYLCDYHLEMARLLLKQWQQQLIDDTAQTRIQNHIAAAIKLVEETGYHRRDAEIAALIGPVQAAPTQQKKWSEEW